jgi:glycosyltransferase involved in cell wall biosynthesis
MFIPGNKIRVLYVVENTSYGGGERGFGQLSSAINRDHFLPYIAAHPGGILENQAREKSVKFFPINMHRKLHLNTISQISDIIAEHKINIAHSMGSRADFFARMACRKMHDVQIISTIAMLIEGYDVNLFRKAIYKLADCYSSKFVSHFIAVSKALKTRLILERKIPMEKISVIYNGVELDKYDPGPNDSNRLRHSFGIEADCAVVGTIGRLVYQKGFEYFIEAAKLISKKNFNIKFVIVGHGPEEKNLQKMVERAGISQIFTFAGQRFDIPQLLGIFDIFVLPSVLEGLPRVVIEAMAMGKPIVATDIDGVREELIHDRTGLIVPAKNPKALSEAVNSLLDNRASAIQMGNEARKSAEKRFDLKKTVFNIERLYERLLS